MERRDFLKFMGVTSATAVASTALANIPEAHKQIILLDKPKDIIIAHEIPDVDLVITEMTDIRYLNNENVMVYQSTLTGIPENPVPGMHQKSLKCGIIINPDMQVNLYESHVAPINFTFNLITDESRYIHLRALNGRRFICSEYELSSSVGELCTAQISGIEI